LWGVTLSIWAKLVRVGEPILTIFKQKRKYYPTKSTYSMTDSRFSIKLKCPPSIVFSDPLQSCATIFASEIGKMGSSLERTIYFSRLKFLKAAVRSFLSRIPFMAALMPSDGKE